MKKNNLKYAIKKILSLSATAFTATIVGLIAML